MEAKELPDWDKVISHIKEKRGALKPSLVRQKEQLKGMELALHQLISLAKPKDFINWVDSIYTETDKNVSNVSIKKVV